MFHVTRRSIPEKSNRAGAARIARGMRYTLLFASALIFAAACDERILPPPLDGGEGGTGGESAAKPEPTSSPEGVAKAPAFKGAQP